MPCRREIETIAMQVLRIDPHAHLYDSYPLKVWCAAVLNNLRIQSEVCGAVIVVDREGQDSFKRLGQDVGEFGVFSVLQSLARPIVGRVDMESRSFVVVRGVQYVSEERLEVLGLGVERSVPDGAPCMELIARIRGEGGVTCIPWSPGKWLGARGRVVARALHEYGPTGLTVGDIAIRSAFGPPSRLLARARRTGIPILRGTDPLPRAQDAALVGSYGIQLRLGTDADWSSFVHRPADFLSNRFNMLQAWGEPNSVLTSALRFLSTL
jgi:hypothetical protein